MVFLHSILKPKKKSTQWLHEVNSQEVELTIVQSKYYRAMPFYWSFFARSKNCKDHSNTY